MKAILKRVLIDRDFLFALVIGVSILLLLFPLPTPLLDIFLALSISAAVVILMFTLVVKDPIELSIFPTLLLVTTIVRLSLNVASTRLILIKGQYGLNAAGRIIESFGKFVMKDNIIVGVIIFLILTIINFIVITKGSNRIAEVAARFNLDSIPGKQMAIDAELTTGMINAEIAKQRRKRINQESVFYGAMDGANKFVRGDAVVGILITIINLIGGLIVGLFLHDISLRVLFKTYAILTIGDGLVNQIPALLISLASGLLVTKAGHSTIKNSGLLQHLRKNIKSLFFGSGLIGCFAIMPGLPFLPFFIIAIALGVLGYIIKSMYRNDEEQNFIQSPSEKFFDNRQSSIEQQIYDRPKSINVIAIEIGLNISLMSTKTNQDQLQDQLNNLHKKLSDNLGFALPIIHLKENFVMPVSEYKILIKEIETAKGNIQEGKLLAVKAFNKTNTKELEGIDTKDPIYNIDAKWIIENVRSDAINMGYKVLAPFELIVMHAEKIIRENIADILSYTDTQKILDAFSIEHQKLVQDVIPEKINIGTLQKVLQNLLKENVSIRDFPAILEAIVDIGKKDTVKDITEAVRIKLSRQICNNVCINKKINVIMLSDNIIKELFSAIDKDGNFNQNLLTPDALYDIVRKIGLKFKELGSIKPTPVLITIPNLRPYVKSLLNQFYLEITVLSDKEVHPSFMTDYLGVVE